MLRLTLEQMVLRLVVILPALTVHEFAHAYSAYLLGDPTARMQGRMSLNPLVHIDPIGTIIVPIFVGFGWAKPVPVNPMNFRDPARGSMITSAWGPLSNLCLAVVIGVLVRLLVLIAPGVAVGANVVVSLLLWMTAVNIMLAIFNLIPLGPLDGHHIVEALLPYDKLVKYRQFNRYGMIILLGVIFLLPRVLETVIFLPAITATHLLTGIG
ncbi:MAG: site-2 protease family protein [Planctomycetota bacterium]|jgi:Zn-dependent protease